MKISWPSIDAMIAGLREEATSEPPAFKALGYHLVPDELFEDLMGYRDVPIWASLFRTPTWAELERRAIRDAALRRRIPRAVKRIQTGIRRRIARAIYDFDADRYDD